MDTNYNNDEKITLKPAGFMGVLFRQLLPFLLIALIILAGLVAYVVWQWSNNLTQEQPGLSQEEVEQWRALEDMYAAEPAPVAQDGRDSFANFGLDATGTGEVPEGIIVFTGYNPDLDPNSNVYFLEVRAGSETAPFIPGFIPEDNYAMHAKFLDPQNPKDLFMRTFSGPSWNAGEFFGVHYYDYAEGRVYYYDSVAGSEQRRFAWTPETQRLAMVRLEQKDVNQTQWAQIDSWEIVVLDPRTNELVARVEDATQPYWSPDGTKLVYLKNDGLYLHDFQRGEVKKVHGLTSNATLPASSMMTVSPDGELLMWTTPKSGIITVFDIASWDFDSFALTERGRLVEPQTEFYWPQFSPDSNYYVVQAIDALQEGQFERTNARLEVRAVDGRSVLWSYPLAGFDFNALLTNDWITGLPSVAN